jgi:SAM-dependent methyltransferase
MKRFGFILLLALTLFGGAAEALSIKECVVRFSKFLGFGDLPIFNNPEREYGAITGSDVHPRESLFESLGLPEEQVEALAGRSVLSLGEGYSDLVPYLIWIGVKAQGLDLWYHKKSYPKTDLGRLMEGYNKKFGQYLIQGDARDTGLAPNSYDFVVSANLVDNLKKFEDKISVLDEAIRLTKVGGQVRILGFKSGHIPNLLLLESAGYGNQIELQIFPVKQRVKVRPGWNNDEQNSLLVYVRKLGNTHRKSFEYLPFDDSQEPLPALPRAGWRITM